MMRKRLVMSVAGLMCACCLGLAACADAADTVPASEASNPSATVSEEAPASSGGEMESATDVSGTDASAWEADVDPGLVEAGQALQALADEQEAIVEKAQAAGSYDAVRDEWEASQKKIDEVTEALGPWKDQYAGGTLSGANFKYYMEVIGPASMRSASAGLDMMDIIKE